MSDTPHRFIRALRRERNDRTPVWLMRQAGRYLPEYRATRERAGNFLNLCKTPELACEVTLQPLARFPLDAAILFSDILTVPDAMGLGLTLDEGVGPRFTHPLRDPAAAARLGIPDPETDLRYVTDAVRLIKRELQGKTPLIGFAGSPWTLATYMIEGGGHHDFKLVKNWLYGEPAAFEALVNLLADAVTVYLNAQIAAGVDAVMVFDTWGGVLTTDAYERYSLAPMQRIVQGLSPGTPNILFTKGGGLWLESMAATGCTGLGCDWSVDLGNARRRVGDLVALQGNLDPAILRAPVPVIEQEVDRVLDAFGGGAGHIFNLGHGITPDINPEHVAAMVARVHARQL
ncbi:MAG: uroporphyrinogen decarboxylase [Gammaproteobacteria bacterium]|nr:uroporphyrinogen decarboxylase [Gammaproteobacteria bacterium]